MRKKSRKINAVDEIAFPMFQAIASGEGTPKTACGKNPMAVALGRLGGLKGGHARASKMTAKERSDGAKKAAQTRWQDNANKPTSKRIPTMPESKRKNKAAAPEDVQELFRQLQIEKREAREYFRRLATKGGRISEYRLTTWLSNNTRPLADER